MAASLVIHLTHLWLTMAWMTSSTTWLVSPKNAHDNCVWKNTPECQEPEKCLSVTEYILFYMTFSPRNYWIPSYKCVRGAKLSEYEDQFNINDTLSAPRVASGHTIGSWRGCGGCLCKIFMRVTNDPCLLKKLLELINSTVVIHMILIWNDNLVDINTWLDVLECDKFSNMEDFKHVPDEETLFPEAPIEEHGANNSRCTFPIYLSVSTIKLQVPALVKILTKIPLVCLGVDALFHDKCNIFIV